MKTPSDELFNLIKSMNGNEKRLFKIYSVQKSDSTNYLKLFDAIDELEQYDEKVLLKRLAKIGGIKNINFIKNYLLEAIFTFLEYHYSDSSVETILNRLLQRIEILFNKRLFVSLKKCLVKAEKIATNSAAFPHLFIIMRWKRKLMIEEEDFNGMEKYGQVGFIDELNYTKLHINHLEYQKLNLQVIAFAITKGQHIDKETSIALKKILGHPLLQNPKNALSFPAKTTYCFILGVGYYLLKDWNNAYKNHLLIISYFDETNISVKEKLIVYARFVIILSELKKNTELIQTKNEVDHFILSLPQRAKTKSVCNAYLTLVNNCVDHFISCLNISEAQRITTHSLKDVELYASKQNYIVFYTNHFLLLFYSSQYRKALQYANKIFAIDTAIIRQDIISDLKILVLIVHYELGNEDLLVKLSNNYYKDFKVVISTNRNFATLLQFFNKTIHQNITKDKRKNALIALKKELLLLEKETIFSQIDLISWAESKILNVPMIDILKEKANSK